MAHFDKIILVTIVMACYTEVCCAAIPNAWYDKLSLVIGQQQEPTPSQQTAQTPLLPPVQSGMYQEFYQPQSQLLQLYHAVPVQSPQAYKLLPSPTSHYSYPSNNQCRPGQTGYSLTSSPTSESVYYPKPILSKRI
ncbi:uncharacterized protein LOC143916525 [Arctopsyche grandis]|uniref:uncharacterized protein LOC143916525 n=1 Tax=Arctopsyche grandis TaxID=121162 RepID=UPI00406D940F